MCKRLWQTSEPSLLAWLHLYLYDTSVGNVWSQVCLFVLFVCLLSTFFVSHGPPRTSRHRVAALSLFPRVMCMILMSGLHLSQVSAHRQHELEKMRERHSRTALLQVKSGQVLGARSLPGKSALRRSWTGSWTGSSAFKGGSLTHGGGRGVSYGLHHTMSVGGGREGGGVGGEQEGGGKDVQLVMGLMEYI